MIQSNKMTSMKKHFKTFGISAILMLCLATNLVAQNTCNVTNNPRVNNPHPASVYGTTKIEAVSIYSDQTIVALQYNTSNRSGTFVALASSTYMLVNGKKYPIQAWGQDTDDDIVNLDFDYQYTVQPNTSYRFLMSFPPVPVGVENISIVEPDGFYWYGIHINNTTPLVARTNNPAYSGIGSELIGAEFKVTSATYNGQDISNTVLEADQVFVFYVDEGNGQFSFTNYWRAQNTQSYGVIYGIKQTNYPATNDTYTSTEYKFTWKYYNSYDDQTGSVMVTFTAILIDDIVKFTCKILDLETNDICVYKGYLEQ